MWRSVVIHFQNNFNNVPGHIEPFNDLARHENTSTMFQNDVQFMLKMLYGRKHSHLMIILWHCSIYTYSELWFNQFCISA